MQTTITQKLSTVFEEWAKAKVNEQTMHLIHLANSDLYYGPLYFDSQGEQCLWCDKSAKQFDFSAACQTIRDALDDLPSTVYYNHMNEEIEDKAPEAYEDEDGKWIEPWWEDYYEVDVKDELLGSELKSYI